MSCLVEDDVYLTYICVLTFIEKVWCEYMSEFIPETKTSIWMNGEIVSWDDAKIHVMAIASVSCAIAVFEGIKAFPTKDDLCVFRLPEHTKRLFDSAKMYGMKIPYSEDEVSNAVVETLKTNDIHEECYIRPAVYPGSADIRIKKVVGKTPHLAIIVRPWLEISRKDLTLDELARRVFVPSWRRISSDVMVLKSKCVANYANAFLAHIEAKQRGLDGAIMLDNQGFVCEGPGETVFIVKDKQLLTTPIYSPILASITRETIIEYLAEDMGYQAVERLIERSELYTADEIFNCGTGTDVIPIVEVDGITVGDGKTGPITKQLAEYYREVVTGKVSNYQRWLTPVY